MFSRRDFLQAAVATSAIVGGGGAGSLTSVAATQSMREEDLLKFKSVGNVTLVHVTDLHAQ